MELSLIELLKLQIMKNLFLLSFFLLCANSAFSQNDTLSISGTLSNLKLASMTLIAYNTINDIEDGGWKIYHQKIINTEKDSTYSFHIEFNKDYLYVILIEDFQSLTNVTSNRIIYKCTKSYDVHLDIEFEEIPNCTLDYIVLPDSRKGYDVVTKKNYN